MSMTEYKHSSIRRWRGGLIDEHVLVAEKALGKRLPAGAEVHHVDFNKRNNENTNLVICPSRLYHYLLHYRTKALNSCGNADYKLCAYCRVYDDITRVSIISHKGNKTYAHRACMARERRKWYAQQEGIEWKS